MDPDGVDVLVVADLLPGLECHTQCLMHLEVVYKCIMFYSTVVLVRGHLKKGARICKCIGLQYECVSATS